MDILSLKKANKYTDKKVALETSKVQKELNDYKNTLAGINVNQEAKQSVTGYGIVSLPKNCANGQVSANVKGLTATNLLKNGDFSNGISDWVSVNVESSDVIQITDKFIANGFESVTRGIYQDIQGNTNDKFYISLDYNYVSGSNIDVSARNYNSFDNTTQLDLQNSSGKHSMIFSAKINGVRLYLRCASGHTYNSEIDNIMVINLTQTFGAGNEPTKEQCDKIFANYFNGTKSTISASRLKSVGKNLFDKNGSIVLGKYITPTGYFAVGNGDKFISDYIKVKPNTQYTITRLPTGGTYLHGFYDVNKNFITAITTDTGLYTTPANAEYIRIVHNISEIDSVQVEEGSTATEYEPYKESTVYINGAVELRSLPNGVKDEIRVSGGKAELVKRVSDKVVLNGSESWLIHKSIRDMFVMTDNSLNSKATNDNIVYCDKLTSTSHYPSIDKGISMGGITNPNRLFIKMSDYLDDLVGFKAWLQANPITLTYQLAQPEVIPIQSSGTLVGHPSGTVYVEPVVANAGLYTDEGIGVTHTDLPIDYVETVYKIDESGVQHELDPSEAVIATDKLSFTHPSLVRDDIVFFTYFHNLESTIGETTIEYYDSRYTIKDKTTGKFYKWNVVVDNGVASIELVEVL